MLAAAKCNKCLSNPIELHGTKTLGLMVLPATSQAKQQTLESELETIVSVIEIQYQSECYEKMMRLMHKIDMWYAAKLSEQLSAHSLDVYSYKDSNFIRLPYCRA